MAAPFLKRLVKTMFVGSLVLAVLLFALRWYFLSSTGFYRDLESVNSFGPVYQQIELPGAEDLALARNDELLLVSVDDRAARRDGLEITSGIYLVDLNDPSLQPVSLTDELAWPFFPHGMSIFATGDGEYSVMVINHVDGAHSVEHFVLQERQLIHQKTITDPNFISPNDLVLVDAERFYYSNDRGLEGTIGFILENVFGVEASTVGFYDGQQAVIAAEGIGYANGMQFDPERRLLFVAAVRSFLVDVFSVDSEWQLTPIERLDVGTGVDNIELDEQGDLWIGAHPSLTAFLEYRWNRSPIAPSEVVRIRYREAASEVESIFLDSGELVSGASVALPWEDYLFIGNVMDDHVLVLRR